MEKLWRKMYYVEDNLTWYNMKYLWKLRIFSNPGKVRQNFRVQPHEIIPLRA